MRSKTAAAPGPGLGRQPPSTKIVVSRGFTSELEKLIGKDSKGCDTIEIFVRTLSSSSPKGSLYILPMVEEANRASS